MEAKRDSVDYLYTALNWNFIKLMAQIAQYAEGKFNDSGGAPNYAINDRLKGEKSPLNHIIEHYRQYITKVPYDKQDHQIIWHLAAIAYNAMMEAQYYWQGEPEASILADIVADRDDFLERWKLSKDPETMKSIVEAIEEYRRGDTTPIEQVVNDIGYVLSKGKWIAKDGTIINLVSRWKEGDKYVYEGYTTESPSERENGLRYLYFNDGNCIDRRYSDKDLSGFVMTEENQRVGQEGWPKDNTNQGKQRFKLGIYKTSAFSVSVSHWSSLFDKYYGCTVGGSNKLSLSWDSEGTCRQDKSYNLKSFVRSHSS